MCGLCGVILGKKIRSKKELADIADIFTAMLVANEYRGKHATGIFLSSCDMLLLKAPVSASEFTRLTDYKELMNGLNNRTNAILGHTRWQTIGTYANNANNHPISVGNIIGTHNGTILNHSELFGKFQWKRIAQVDSEAIFALADSCIGDKNEFNMALFAEGLRHFSGTMSHVFVHTLEMQYIYIGYGNMPLSLYYSKQYHCFIYSSETTAIKKTIGFDLELQAVAIAPMHLYRINTDNLLHAKVIPMEFNTATAFFERSNRMY